MASNGAWPTISVGVALRALSGPVVTSDDGHWLSDGNAMYRVPPRTERQGAQIAARNRRAGFAARPFPAGTIIASAQSHGDLSAKLTGATRKPKAPVRALEERLPNCAIVAVGEREEIVNERYIAPVAKCELVGSWTKLGAIRAYRDGELVAIVMPMGDDTRASRGQQSDSGR